MCQMLRLTMAATPRNSVPTMRSFTGSDGDHPRERAYPLPGSMSAGVATTVEATSEAGAGMRATTGPLSSESANPTGTATAATIDAKINTRYRFRMMCHPPTSDVLGLGRRRRRKFQAMCHESVIWTDRVPWFSGLGKTSEWLARANQSTDLGLYRDVSTAERVSISCDLYRLAAYATLQVVEDRRPGVQRQAQLLSLAAHEFRTPASVVGGYLRMLQRDSETPLVPRHRKMVHEAEKAS